MKIVNVSKIVQYPKIDLVDGKTATIRVMPKARIDLPEGSVINQHWLSINPRVLHIFKEEKQVVDVKTDEDSGDE